MFDEVSFREGFARMLTQSIDELEREMSGAGTSISRRRIIAFAHRRWMVKLREERAKDPNPLPPDEWQRRLVIFSEVMKELEQKASN